MLFTIIALLFAFFAAALPVMADDFQIKCNRATDAHCFYTPVKRDRNERYPPECSMSSGRLLGSDEDGAGSVTFLIADGGKGTLDLTCASGGQTHFDFSFGHTSSSITVRRDEEAQGTVHFTEDPGNVAGPGDTVTSSKIGADAIVKC